MKEVVVNFDEDSSSSVPFQVLKIRIGVINKSSQKFHPHYTS